MTYGDIEVTSYELPVYKLNECGFIVYSYIDKVFEIQNVEQVKKANDAYFTIKKALEITDYFLKVKKGLVKTLKLITLL